ncbi:MAG: metallophosphoesterase family protein [Nocardioides sp.]
MTSRALAAALLTLTLALTACAGGADDDSSKGADRAGMTAGTIQEGGPAPLAASSRPVKIVAVGDIACPAYEPTTSRNCRQAQTARLTKRVDPRRVLALGDLQYSRGTAAEFRNSYAKSWGSLKSIAQPLPGNHEYKSGGAAGYYGYFNQKAPGYYAWNAGTWRIYNLNSNCDKIDCDAEEAWLRKDLDARPHRCTIVAMHHPRWSSGLEHGSNASVGRFWRIAYNHRVDVALAGHDHDYERFARMNPSGKVEPRRGIQSFVSGAGGKSLYHLGTREKGSQIFTARAPGVLVMRLAGGGYSWTFRTVDGRVADSGRRDCL